MRYIYPFVSAFQTSPPCLWHRAHWVLETLRISVLLVEYFWQQQDGVLLAEINYSAHIHCKKEHVQYSSVVHLIFLVGFWEIRCTKI